MTEHSSESVSEERELQETTEFDLSEMKPWREFAVILFNDEEHHIDHVEIQLVRALQCHFALARTLAHRVHNSGHAVVAITHRDRAFKIATVLKQIELKVALRQIN